MSVDKLILKEGNQNLVVNRVSLGAFTFDIVEVQNDIWSAKNIGLDRNQAHLLMLYLQEHLKPAISTALDDAITDELANGPKSIMGSE